MAMMETGMTQAEARHKIWMYDKHGLLVKVSVIYNKINVVCAASRLARWITAWLFYPIVIDFVVSMNYCLQGRTQETDSNQEAFLHDSPGDVQSFLDAVNNIKPTAIIGKDIFISTNYFSSKLFCFHHCPHCLGRIL